MLRHLLRHLKRSVIGKKYNCWKTGRLENIYISSPRIFSSYGGWLLSIFTGLIGACLSLSALGFYSFLHDFLYGSPIEFSEILSPFWIIWLVINYFLHFAMFLVTYLYSRNNLKIEPKALRKLLEEVAETDLMGDPEAWRRIASRINQVFIKEKYSNPIFYSGEQCRWFFVREIAKPMDSGSYNIKSYFEGEGGKITLRIYLTKSWLRERLQITTSALKFLVTCLILMKKMLRATVFSKKSKVLL